MTCSGHYSPSLLSRAVLWSSPCGQLQLCSHLCPVPPLGRHSGFFSTGSLLVPGEADPLLGLPRSALERLTPGLGPHTAACGAALPGLVLGSDGGSPLGLQPLCNNCKGENRDLVFQTVRVTGVFPASSEPWQQAPLISPTIRKVKNTWRRGITHPRTKKANMAVTGLYT